MLWILLTVAAAPLQVARNAFQRGVMGDAGPWGATLVRFLFGLPFSILLFLVVIRLTPGAHANPTLRFWFIVTLGSLGQIAGTSCMLMAMQRSGFAVATFLQQGALPIGALIGWLVFGDSLRGFQWAGIAVTCAGLAILSWPGRAAERAQVAGVLFGLAAGVGFAVSLNGYRQAGIALEPHHPIYAGIGSVVAAQAIQTLLVGGLLAAFRPGALASVLASWRGSLGAGACGAAASAFWFSALAMAPAGAVRAVGVIEAPIAAAAGRRLFREHLTLRQMLSGTLTAVGVVMTALG